jgi:hypothetical protein
LPDFAGSCSALHLAIGSLTSEASPTDTSAECGTSGRLS